jgi:glycerophosphoryl diester phosphodiesterase
MKFISHRGNISGKIPGRENTKEYIEEAIAKGYDVEIDVWCKDGHLWLGHDEPIEKTSLWWLKNHNLWCHAKNIEAAREMWGYGCIHFFYHQTDDITLTSSNYFWTYPGKRPLTDISVAVLPEHANWKKKFINRVTRKPKP